MIIINDNIIYIMNLYTICTLSDTFWTTLTSQPGSMLCAEEMSSRSWAMFKARSKSRLNAQWPDCAKTRTKTGQAMYGGDILWFYVALVCHRPSFKIRQPMNSPSTSCPGLNAGELLLLAHPFAAMWCSSKSGGAAAQLPVSMAYSTEVSTSSKPLFQLGICQNARAPEWFMSMRFQEQSKAFKRLLHPPAQLGSSNATGCKRKPTSQMQWRSPCSAFTFGALFNLDCHDPRGVTNFLAEVADTFWSLLSIPINSLSLP